MKKYKKWTKEEVDKLIEIYPNEKNENIALLFDKDKDQVERKAHSIGLKKSKEQISRNISNRNKLVGRDLSYENLKNISLKYKTRGEFQRLDGSAYTTARIAGYLNDICSHMILSSYSIPQLILCCIIECIFDDKVEYNYKYAIKPYELDIYIKKYKIAFEYDGKLWHENNQLDKIKDKMCENKKITLIRLIENNRKYEQDIKEQLIKNLNLINKTCNKNFSKDIIEKINSEYINSYVSYKISDEQEIKNIIRKYENFHDFRINEMSLYMKLLRRKILDKYTSHLKRNRITWTLELVNKEIEKYDNLGDFIKNSNPCYIHIKKNKLSYLLNNLKSKKLSYKIDEIEIIVKEYKYLKDFRTNFPKIYWYIEKNNLNYLIKDLIRTPHGKKRIFSMSDIEDEIKKYEYLIDFRNNSKQHYHFIKAHNLYYLIKDLKRKPQFFINDIENEIKKYNFLKDFREKSPKYYKYIITHKLNYLMKELKKL